jgi:hypothetical protein
VHSLSAASNAAISIRVPAASGAQQSSSLHAVRALQKSFVAAFSLHACCQRSYVVAVSGALLFQILC